MARRSRTLGKPLPAGFLDWQVKLRRWTMREQHGAPHAGVAPLVLAEQPGVGTGASAHSIICGLLPHESRLEEKTKEFRQLYEAHIADGARAVYDAGIAYLLDYYRDRAAFDPASITTLLPDDRPLVQALRRAPDCSLLFYVFDLHERSEEGRFRCQQLDCRAEILDAGPVYDNVWEHNTLFHGPADEQVVIRFHHQRSWDTAFGGFEELGS